MKIIMKAVALIVALPLVAAFPRPGAAQVAEVRQVIFGMDCAPCAYAVERRMRNLDGAREVEISLNEGFAMVRFAGTHGTTLDQVRRMIRDSGFGPREARVRVRGTLVLEGDRGPVLRIPAGEGYRVVGAEEGLLDRIGMELELEGWVDREADEAGRWVLRTAVEAGG